MTNTYDFRSRSYWENISKCWDMLGSPSRPSSEDLDFIKRRAFPHLQSLSPNPAQVTLLGVTPEIGLLPWPDNVKVLAVDRSPEMIGLVWPKDKVTNGEAISGDWHTLPLADSSCDMVVGDCCFTLLDYSNGYQTVLKEIFRVLKPQGLFSMRFFLRPDLREKVETIFEQLKAGSIGNLVVFRWRLAMALQKNTEEGVLVHDIWRMWQQNIPAPDELMQYLGWSLELLALMACYENSPNVFRFPTLSEVRQVFSSHFDEISCDFPNYELGERCPTMMFSPQNKLK